MLERRDLNLFRLLTIGQAVLIVATWRVWFPQLDFPQVPLISCAGRIPRSAELGILLLETVGLVALLLLRSIPVQRIAILFVAICSGFLILIDQHRLQPWAYQFLVLAFVLALSDGATSRRNWCWMVIGIYAWSAWSKIDYGFCLRHGPFLLDGLLGAIGMTNGTRLWPVQVRSIVSAAIPLFELLIAIGLCFHRTRRVALWGATGMHLGLLLALGPFGHRHQPGVLVWNLFFVVQDWVLFGKRTNLVGTASSSAGEVVEGIPPATAQSSPWAGWGNRISTAILILVMAWPVLEPFGLCDHWTSWAVYAAKPEVVSVFIREDEASQFPSNMSRYFITPSIVDEWRQVRIDRWSLDTVMVPLYPQDRFQVGVALGMVDRFDLKHLKVVIESPADRWTGRRTTRVYDSIAEVEKLASTYRLGAKPRLRLD